MIKKLLIFFVIIYATTGCFYSNHDNHPDHVFIIDTLMNSDTKSVILWTFQTEGYLQGEWSRLRMSVLEDNDSLKKDDGFLYSNWITNANWSESDSTLIINVYRPDDKKKNELYDLREFPDWIRLEIIDTGKYKDMIYYNLPDPYLRDN
ncbi:MAG: hypothetical protein JXC36_09065 [Candidatus Atribacteria bacterium]|nr:hypothetical protein [Candidatus Atribacteria bacterium]